MPSQDDVITPNPLDDDGVQEQGEYLDTALDEVAAAQAAQEAASGFADSFNQGSDDDDEEEEEAPPPPEESTGSATPPPGMEFLAVSESALNQASMTSGPESEELESVGPVLPTPTFLIRRAAGTTPPSIPESLRCAPTTRSWTSWTPSPDS